MVSRRPRTVSLTPDIDRFIDEQVAAGTHGDADAVIRAALERARAERPAKTRWPVDGGTCGRLIREHDWAATSLGPIEQWSAALRTTVDNIVNSPVPKVLMWGPDHIMLYNDEYSIIAGANHPAALGGTVPGIWPDIWDWNRAILEAGFRGEGLSYRDQPMVLHRNGRAEDVVFDLFYTPVHLADGTVGGVMCTVVEHTERVRVERALAASEAELRTVTDALPVLIAYIDRDLVYRFANHCYEEWLGTAAADIVGQPVRAVVGDRIFTEREPLMRRALAGERITLEAPMPHVASGSRRCQIHYLPRTGDDGVVAGFHALVFDVEERERHADQLGRQIRHRERAEAQLRDFNETLEARVIAEIAERRQAEIALAQSQKMETIGKLTGGVAHDFNNLLQVVSGNLQLLARDIEGTGDARAARRIANAMAGVERGSKLAAQLLAFGRRQALEPKVVNVTRFVQGMDDMLRRAIGEGIEIETVVADDLWNTFVDPTQIENALLNLAINARDAMNGQGRLTIELANATLDRSYARRHAEVAPGDYVCLAVTDTGTGMAPDLLDKVFEPFFSTKVEGKGSGLGLSMVYGFVKQSGGHVKIYSEVGHGTTIRLYLPRAAGAEDVEMPLDAAPVTGGSETVLVVEDDDAVRETVVAMLGDLGYRVLKAVDAQDGLAVIESGVAIDMLFTDVVMPGTLKSPELARRAKARLPDLAVLFTSGYTENSIVHGGRLDAGVELLSKPYTREALARKFAHVLAPQRRRRATPAPAPLIAAPPPPARVLLVEDDALILSNTAEALEEAGYAVAVAADAAQALAVLAQRPVDVLVTDVNLPDLSGPALVERARALYPELGVVFATGDIGAIGDDPASRTLVLAKPYGAYRLFAAIAAAASAPA